MKKQDTIDTNNLNIFNCSSLVICRLFRWVLCLSQLFMIIRFINFLQQEMHKSILSRFLPKFLKSPYHSFMGMNPKRQFEQLKQKLKKVMPPGSFNDQNYNKYKIAFGVYLLACFVCYELKKEKSIQITRQEVIDAIKKSQTNIIYVVKLKEKGDDEKERQNAQRENNPQIKSNEQAGFIENKLEDSSRNIYLKIDGVEHFAFVPNIDLFYEKLAEVEKNKTVQKVKIIQRDVTPIDQKLKRFFSSINGLIIPLVFPLLLMNSSIGKMFRSKVLGQADGFRPNIKFKDIAGLGNAKIQVSQLVDFLKNPDKYKKIGAKVPKGALLSGPPGTGKTMLAKACAGQADVPFFSVSGSQFVELYAGMGATRVRQLFKNAKKQTPAIIFIDEIDAIGRKRDDKFGGANDERANTLNQLLVQMDGFGTSDDIIILAATNRKEMLDNALTRPGRFDRMVEIELPDIRGRQQILQIYLRKIKLSPKQYLEDYAKRLATLTYGFSGADLANLCNQAAIFAVRNNHEYVNPSDFETASDRVLAGLQQNLNLQPIERKKIAYHEAGHAVVAWFSEGASPLLKITIVPRSKGSLGFAQYLPNQSTLMNKKQILDQICVILGGRTAEQVFFKQVSTGASDDLQKVRNLVRAMITKFGMSDAFPNFAPAETDGHNVYSQKVSGQIDRQVIKIVEFCTRETRKIVKSHRAKIQALASEVLKKQTLNHQEIKAILGDRPFEIKENYRQFLQNAKEVKRADQLV